MEAKISQFILKVSKFEFFLINTDITLAHFDRATGAVTGLNWTRLAALIEAEMPFSAFNFQQSGFSIFKDTAPQYLTISPEGCLKWDSDDQPIDSWERLLSRSFAQLRNNVAHGNKAQMTAPFTLGRTEGFLNAGDNLIEFIAEHVFHNPDWQTPIMFR